MRTFLRIWATLKQTIAGFTSGSLPIRVASWRSLWAYRLRAFTADNLWMDSILLTAAVRGPDAALRSKQEENISIANWSNGGFIA